MRKIAENSENCAGTKVGTSKRKETMQRLLAKYESFRQIHPEAPPWSELTAEQKGRLIHIAACVSIDRERVQ